MITTSLALLFAAAYLAGSVPFAIVSSRLFGLDDPRSYGSGNPGATNILRSGSKAAAALTLAGDCFKGWLAVWAAFALGFDALTAALAGLAAFVGHAFSIFLRFKGGKGVATALGALLGINVILAFGCLSVWLLVALASRYSSMASLVAAAAAPVIAVFVTGDLALAAIVLLIAAILAWRHAPNIKQILSGTEKKIGAGKCGV
ncbi:MAG: glycerol-3-phosphate 1-O-acyltransferase PlsY [Azoarcus sp.]|jgi:glycerol-3-phosphate acyltransferase PlsY|nr:glycerol-3-phosphate 1-O-acyltransferase PlsY [Azoarcus sp.]